MDRKILSKLLLTLVVLGWAVYSLYPVRDIPFEVYISKRPTAFKEEFAALAEQANQKVQEGSSQTMFLALKHLAQEEDLDLARFFPDLNLVDVKNQQKRNDILLNHLLGEAQGKLKKGLDLQGGVAFTLEVDKLAHEEHVKQAQLEKAIQIMGNRVNGLGVSEPVIRAKGSNQIEIQLPGLNLRDNPEVVYAIKKPAKLEFRFVHPDPYFVPGAIPAADVPAGYESLSVTSVHGVSGEAIEREYFVQKLPVLTGTAVKNAYVSVTPYGGYDVGLTLTPEGAQRFAQITRENIGRQLGIVLDGQLYAAPVINSEIPTGNASISGDFSQRDALELANVLNNPLAFELSLQEVNEIGPSLASDARQSSINAAILGAALVIAFMVLYYFGAGIVAVVSVLANVLIVLGVLASIQATITLPGVAALVLTIGMGVDANILIFERIREEIKQGKSIKSALHFGFEKAFSTIVDSNLTTLLAAGILIWLGTGPIKGFGVTLAIGIVASLFSALVISRALLELCVGVGIIRKIIPYSVFKETHFDFLKYRRIAFIVSWVLVVLGAWQVSVKGDKIYGIDFLGGDELTIKYSTAPSVTAIEALCETHSLGKVQAYFHGSIGDASRMLKMQTVAGKGTDVFTVLNEAFPDSGLELVGNSSIGASISKSLRTNAWEALGVSLIGILVYVAFRFEFGFGLGAIVSTAHDVLMSIGIFVLLGGQFNASMVAAILMIVGYSINDTIIVFDRIREELGLNPTMSLGKVINLAINKTLSRTLLTSVTTFLAALSLYVFGAGQIDDFALVFMIGIVTGTFSSIFIASPVFYWWHKGDRRNLEKKNMHNRTYEWETSASK